jgi:spore coat polysaccharide biosynthesis predicted glycosyltransferase SpsG
MDRVVFVIPARAGSIGVHRKHERPVAGVPLMSRVMTSTMLAAARLNEDHDDIEAHVAVTTNDPDVHARAQIFAGSEPMLFDIDGEPYQVPVTTHVLWRLDDDVSTPDAPVTDAVTEALLQLAERGFEYDIVAICQPTAPTLQWDDYADAVRYLVDNPDLDSAATMRPFSGFVWSESGPQMLDRVNRQWAEPRYIETGGIQVCRDYPRSDGWYGEQAPQIGASHEPLEVSADKGIDIDDASDLAAAETVLSRYTLLIVAQGSPAMGSGHLHRAAAIAAQLDPYAIVSIAAFDTPDDMARRFIPDRWLLDRVRTVTDVTAAAEHAEVVVVDCLDNPAMSALTAMHGDKVIRFECDDLDCGAAHHVNALYRHDGLYQNEPVCFGPDWLDLRWDFLGLPPIRPRHDAPILVTFGGTDPANWTAPVSTALIDAGFDVVAVVPPAASEFRASDLPDAVSVSYNPHMPGLIAGCAAVVTSRGRTAWETAYMHRPVVCLPANEREAARNSIPAFAVEADTARGAAAAVASLTADRTTHLTVCASMSEDIDGRGLDRITTLITSHALTRQTRSDR